MIQALDEVDLFVTRAAAEVVRMYRQELTLPKSARIFRDTLLGSREGSGAE